MMTILQENHHSFLIVEHDPLLYEDAKEMVEYVAQHLKQASREATVLLYAPALDPHPRRSRSWLTLMFCIYGEPARGRAGACLLVCQVNLNGRKKQMVQGKPARQNECTRLLPRESQATRGVP